MAEPVVEADAQAGARAAIAKRWPQATLVPDGLGRPFAVGAKKIRHAAVMLDGCVQIITLDESVRHQGGEKLTLVQAYGIADPQAVQYAHLADPDVLSKASVSKWLTVAAPHERAAVESWWGQAVSMAIAASLAQYPKGPCVVLMEHRSMLSPADNDTDVGFVLVADSRLNQGWTIRADANGSASLIPVRFDRGMLAASIPLEVPELTTGLVDQINESSMAIELVQIPTTRSGLRVGMLLVPELLDTAADMLIAALAEAPSLDPESLGKMEYSQAAELARGYREQLEQAAGRVHQLGAFAGVSAAPAVLAHLDAIVTGSNPAPSC